MTYILFFPMLILDLGITRKYIFIIRMPVAFKVVLFVYMCGNHTFTIRLHYLPREPWLKATGLSRDAFELTHVTAPRSQSVSCIAQVSLGIMKPYGFSAHRGLPSVTGSLFNLSWSNEISTSLSGKLPVSQLACVTTY